MAGKWSYSQCMIILYWRPIAPISYCHPVDVECRPTHPHIMILWHDIVKTIIVMISQIMILSHIIIIWYWKAQLWSSLNWPTLRSTGDELHLTSVYHVFISSCIHIMSWCLDIVNSAYLSIWTHGWRGWRLPGFSDELVCCTWKHFINIIICNYAIICYTCKYK